MSARKAIRFDSRFIDEMTTVAKSMPQRQCEWMSSVGIRKEFAGRYDLPTIEKLEDIFWIVAQGKAQAARAGVTL